LNIRDHVEVIAQPTVVRLEHLQAPDSAWITDSYYITEETERHFDSLRVLFSKDTGCGVFLIGHYGCGKSHFLAYLAQQLQAGSFAPRNPAVVPISLLNFKATQPLESILDETLAISPGETDRRKIWRAVARRYPGGLLLALDELSEFLRSKSSPQSFNEDLRFLQFLGEWAQGRPLWILAALQEQIEHTGEIEYDLFRKIKDRYPVRLLLSPAHIKSLIAQRILRKKPTYQAEVEKLAKELREVYPESVFNYEDFCEIYPLHPVTLELLEEVRDRFSQARGTIDFTLNQLLGNEVRGIAPFLDRPWGHLITPDLIVDHFRDLFEVQPEFLALAQKVLPHFRKQIPSLFENKLQQELAWRLLKLLILVHLSPRRESLGADEGARWLLFKVSSIDPAKNLEIVKRVFDVMVQEGAYLKRKGARYSIDLQDDSKEYLEQLLSKTIDELKGRGDFVVESLIPSLHQAEFNPFTLPRDRWHTRKVRWHFHEWDIQIYLGGGAPEEPKGLALQIGLPWGPPAEGGHGYRILPARLEISPEILEFAALHYLKDRPLSAKVLARVQERIAARVSWFRSLLRAAYNDAIVMAPQGSKSTPPLLPLHGGLNNWLNAYAEWMLRQTYPMFERFAPGYGPLPKEAYRQFMKFAGEHDLGSEQAPDFVRLLREAYLIPMGLMQRRGSEYAIHPKLDTHELVRLLVPILEHHPTPARVYQHLSTPVYGLVPDQIHLLLLILLIQGEIDIVKGDQSYRDVYETLINPLQYDKILPGRALNLNQLRDLQILCEGFHIPTPKQWSVLAQKRAIEQLRKYGGRQRDQLSEFATKLKSYGEAGDLVEKVEKLISQWLALDKGEHELQGFQHLSYAIVSPQRFIAEANEIASLPARFERLLRETQRFQHLFGNAALAQCSNPEITNRLEALQPPPPLSQPEDLESWLGRAQALYQRYQGWYVDKHEQWRDTVSRHRIWSYRIPALSRSRHVAAAEITRELESLIAEAKKMRCAGLTSLDFLPLCRCGFDGFESPLSAVLCRFDNVSQRLEQEMGLFFQQDKVKAKVLEWIDQGLEVSTGTLSSLEGKSDYPDVENLSLFDQHLSGLELVRPVPADDLLNLLGERVWEKAALMKTLDEFFQRIGPRISFRREEAAPRQELVAWCCRQALEHATPLPAGLSSGERSLVAGLIQPSWVSQASLANLDRMGLPEEAVLRILDMLLNGLVTAPSPAPDSGPIAAALELLGPEQPSTPGALAEKITCLYEQNERFLKLRPQLWLSHLDEVAQVALPAPPERLDSVLGRHLDAQWVLVDCLGLPIVNAVRDLLHDVLPHWKLRALEFGSVSEQSSTDAFYLGLIGRDFKKAFEKIDAVDNLIHERKLNLRDLARLACAELEIAFKKLTPRLDPTQPILVFGDHGFRLKFDGSGFTHGGSSTLERITPVFMLGPF
jgi:hypothetical protein